MADLSTRQGIAWRYLEDKTTTEILYGGGAGGGKSWLGALWLLSCCLRYPGTRWLMGRAVLKTLKETTLNSFFDVCAAHGLKAGEHYVYNAQTSQITIGQSAIILKDLATYPSDPNFDDLGSLEITGGFIDEANQVSSKAKAIVGSRMRYKLDEFGLVPKLLMTCNPAKNWVYSEFYDPHKRGELPKAKAFVQALVTDNPAISPHYIEKLRGLTGADRERLLMGNWDYDDDPSILMDWDAINDLFTNEHVPAGDKYLTCDVARYGSDKTVVMLWSGLRVLQIYVYSGQATNATAAAIESTAKMEGVPRSRIIIDDDGVGGGVVDLLPGCIGFKGGSRPIEVKGEEPNYANLKAQCCYELAQRVNRREVYVSPTEHRDTLSHELSWVRRDKMDHDGKLRILPKDKVKEGLGRSPDFADNLMMRMVGELTHTEPIAVGILEKQGQKRRQERVRKAVRDGWRMGMG